MLGDVGTGTTIKIIDAVGTWLMSVHTRTEKIPSPWDRVPSPVACLVIRVVNGHSKSPEYSASGPVVGAKLVLCELELSPLHCYSKA